MSIFLTKKKKERRKEGERKEEKKKVSMRVARASASLLSSHGRVPGTSPG